MAEAISRDSFVWTSTGVEPAQGDEVFEAGEQPIAEYDNWALWAITSDIKDLSETLGSHGTRHESGGADQIDLDGLDVGSGGGVSSSGADLIDIVSQSDAIAAQLDTAAGEWLTFPSINDPFTLLDDVTLSGAVIDVAGNDIVDSGSTVYDGANGHIPASAVEDAFIRKSGGGLTQDLQVNEYNLDDVNEVYLSGTRQNIHYGGDAGFALVDDDTGEHVVSIDAASFNFRRPLHLPGDNGKIVGDAGDVHVGQDHIGFTGTTNFHENEANEFRFENRTSDPSSPPAGRVWIRTDL